MEFKLVYGPAGSGKTHYLLDLIQNNQKEGRKSILLVPEQYTKSYEDLVLDRFGGSLSSQLEVLSFQRLSLRVFESTGGVCHPYISKAGKNIMMAKVFLNMQKELKILRKTAASDGLVQSLMDIISEFKRYGHDAGQLEAVCGSFEKKPLLLAKLSDLTLLLQAYDQEIGKHHMDKDDDLHRLLQSAVDYQGWAETDFYIDGFFGFTAIEFDVLLQMIQKSNSTYLSLPLANPNDNSELYRPVAKTVRRLQARLESIGISAFETIRVAAFATNQPEDLKHLAQNLYRFPVKSYEKQPENIHISCAPDVFTEVQAAAADILELTYQKKARLRDMTLLVSDLETYGPLLKNTLSQCGIPCFLDKKEPLLNHPLVLFSVSALECVLKNYTRDTVFRLLKTGLFQTSLDDIDAFENYCLLKGIKWNDYKKEDKWQLSEEQQQLYPNVLMTKAACIQPVLHLEASLKKAKTANEYAAALYAFLQATQVFDTLTEKAKRFTEEGAFSKATQYIQVWNILMDALDQLVYVMADQALTPQQFTQLLKSALGEYEIKLIPQALDEIQITTKDRLSVTKKPYLFFLGVNDGMVPSASSAEGLLKDADREALIAAGFEVAQGHAQQAYDEQFLLYKVLTTPSAGLHLSYPQTGVDGTSLYPSMLLSALTQLFPKLTPQAPQKNHLDEYLLAGPLALEQLVEHALLTPPEDGLVPRYTQIFQSLRKKERERRLLGQILSALKYQNVPDKLHKSQVAALFGPEINLSISQLEAYASCQFAYYMKYLLRAKERQEFKVSAIDLGFLLHLALELFAKRLQQESIGFETVTEEQAGVWLNEIFESALFQKNSGILKDSRRNEYIKMRLYRILKRCVLLLKEQFEHSDFRPAGYEMTFDHGGDFPPIELSVDGVSQPVYIRGKIDRIDTSTDEESQTEYVRVVDYKSGAKTLKLSEVLDGLNLQLFTYLDAVVKSLSRPGNIRVLPSGVLYFRIFDPILSAKIRMDEDQLERELKRNMRMNGLVLRDEHAVHKMDHHIDGASDFIPVTLNKDGSVKQTGSTADAAQFYGLLEQAGKTTRKLSKNLLGGKIAINPYRSGEQSSCTYCPFAAACGFDKEYNRYRMLSSFNDAQVLEEVEKHER